MKRLGALLAAGVTLAAAAQSEPARPTVVSLDYCADQFVLGLADRDQILGVSKDADKAFSHLRARADGLRQVRASGEDVIALRPDLVVRSWGGSARDLDFYRRFGIEVAQIGYAQDIEGVRRETRAIGEALGRSAQAESLIRAMPSPAPRSAERSALYLTPGGVTAGERTLVGALIHAAALENGAGEGGWQSLPLERLVLAPPAVALTAFFEFDTDAADHWSLSRHPVLNRILADAQRIRLDETRLTCPAWFVAQEAAAIAEALE
ncbi:MAG: ABC transporter substrate-binding protein [Pseudomonadota bacterium]